MSVPYYINATGNVGAASGGEIKKVVLTPAAAVATLTLRQNGAGGTVIMDVQAAANGSSIPIDFEDPYEGGLTYSGQLHATIAGVGASAVVGL